MITNDLSTQSRRDLLELAKQLGVAGGHSMKKDDLVVTLTRIQQKARKKSAKPGVKEPTPEKKRVPSTSLKTKPEPKKKPSTVPQSVASIRAAKNLARLHAQSLRDKDLSNSIQISQSATRGRRGKAEPLRDRLVLIVRDSFWIQATWEVTRESVQRASAAMSENWHSAYPILRLFRVFDGAGANATEQQLRDIPIHGGVNTWYLDVEEPGSRYRAVIGYLSDSGRLFPIARSNLVQTPMPGACDMIEGHWSDIAADYERVYAMSGGGSDTTSDDLKALFEERLERPMIDPTHHGSGGEVVLRRDRDLNFKVDAELIIFGVTDPGSAVSLGGEPVRVRTDGTFTVRVELPDKRQVLPVVASSRDGLRQRTTVIAVERNTKVMEQIIVDDDD